MPSPASQADLSMASQGWPGGLVVRHPSASGKTQVMSPDGTGNWSLLGAHTRACPRLGASAARDLFAYFRLIPSCNDSASSTILTITRRLLAVIDHNRIMILDAGRIVESGRPAVLLADRNSRFHKMCRSAGREEFSILKKRAGVAVANRRLRFFSFARFMTRNVIPTMQGGINLIVSISLAMCTHSYVTGQDETSEVLICGVGFRSQIN
ncbi:hypothetical protein F5141DRAFT_1261331 [Pisolithus sp. B1]|nr:hypothetical protein F5141DRAFT_1261331 [Pisolithus sp. B1]